MTAVLLAALRETSVIFGTFLAGVRYAAVFLVCAGELSLKVF